MFIDKDADERSCAAKNNSSHGNQSQKVHFDSMWRKRESEVRDELSRKLPGPTKKLEEKLIRVNYDAQRQREVAAKLSDLGRETEVRRRFVDSRGERPGHIIARGSGHASEVAARDDVIEFVRAVNWAMGIPVLTVDWGRPLSG